jgi:uracil-DNA glycosylase
MKGFFDLSLPTISKSPIPLLPRCGSCGLFKHCKSAKMPVFGGGRRGIMIVGENPGRNEDRDGRPFCGRSGQFLRNVLYKYDVNMDRDCYLYNATICHKHDEEGKNLTPTEKEIEWCRPNVLRVMRELDPKTIILLGASAVLSVLGYLWKEDVGSISRWVGWQIPNHTPNCYICPTFHPSYVQRQYQNKDNVAQILFMQHIEQAVSKTKRPWSTVPRYQDSIRTLFDENLVSEAIEGFIKAGKPCSWDIEAEGLKPDNSELSITSCAISNGTATIAYPWHGKSIQATKTFLKSPIPKIAANLKYEDRWIRSKLGVEINNWVVDTMLMQHCLDNRPGICSLKFMSFVYLGMPSYDDHIKSYFESGGSSNQKNRINNCDISQLLIYNGLDALLEWKLAKILSKRLNVSLDNEKEKV